MIGNTYPTWPLARVPASWTKLGSFGAPRDNGTRYHQGIDLYAPEGTPVIASQDGVITYVQSWDGPGTKGLLVHTPSEDLEKDITILYGAVAPNSYPPIGTEVKQGQQIATVGVYPKGSTMLHYENWLSDLKPPRPSWKAEQPKPMALVDPTDYLNRARGDFVEKEIQSTSRSYIGPLAIIGMGAIAWYSLKGK